MGHHLLAGAGRLGVVELPGLVGVPVLGLHLVGGTGGGEGKVCNVSGSADFSCRDGQTPKLEQ